MTIVCLLLIAVSAQAGGAFLPRVGPPPLRFAPAAAKTVAFVWPSLAVQTNAIAAKPEANGTNTLALAPAELASPLDLTNENPPAWDSSSFESAPSPKVTPDATTPFTHMSTADQAFVAPAMVLDLLRDQPSGTNVLSSPGLLFVPPLPPALTHTSRATYQVK